MRGSGLVHQLTQNTRDWLVGRLVTFLNCTMLATTLRLKDARSALCIAAAAQVSKLRSFVSTTSGTTNIFMVRGLGPTAGYRPSTHESDDLTNVQGDPPLMFVGRWRKVGTAGAVDLRAVSWLGRSGSRVVSMAKGIVTRWKADAGRDDNSFRVNAVDSAGRNPDAGHPCAVELEANCGRQVRQDTTQTPRKFLVRACTWLWVTSRPPLANCLKSRHMKLFGNEKVPSGAKTKELRAVLAWSWARIVEATLVVSRGVLPEALPACARKQARWHKGLERDRRLFSDALTSVAVIACEMKASIGLAPAGRLMRTGMSQTHTKLPMA